MFNAFLQFIEILLYVHVLGTYMIFISGVVYAFLDATVSWLICSHFKGHSRCLCYLRLGTAACIAVFFVLCILPCWVPRAFYFISVFNYVFTFKLLLTTYVLK